VGVATVVPQLKEHLSDFIASADHALYRAKTCGRNKYIIAEPKLTLVDTEAS
jgi:PleD family two-component response regulator